VAIAQALRGAGEPVRAIAAQHLRRLWRPRPVRPLLPRLRAAPSFTREEIVAALRAWTAEYGQPPRHPDWKVIAAEGVAHRAVRARQLPVVGGDSDPRQAHHGSVPDSS
jgi:hypothetical protein